MVIDLLDNQKCIYYVLSILMSPSTVYTYEIVHDVLGPNFIIIRRYSRRSPNVGLMLGYNV